MAEPLQDVAQYLPAARSGSREALGQVLEAYRAYLLLIANRQRDFAQFRGTSGDEFQAWLRQLLLHNLANFARRYRDTDKRSIGCEVALEEETPSGGYGQNVTADT